MNVNSLLEGASPYQVQQYEAAKLSSKWEKSGLLEGIKSSTEANNMAMLLENQAKQLVNEANSTGGVSNQFTAGNSEAWAGVALPLVRRVFGEIVAKDLVSVQPMNLPAGLIFYLDFQYGQANGGKASGESLYGATDDLKRTEGAFNEGLYGAGEFGYSMNETSSKLAQAGGAASTSAATTASATFAGILNGDTEFSASNAGEFGSANGVDDTVKIVSFPTASLTDFDPEGIRAFQITSSLDFSSFFPQFTRLNGGQIEFVVKQSTDNASLGDVTITYQKGPDNLGESGDFEDKSDNTNVGTGYANSSLDIPEINVQLRSDTVAAKTRKLKAQWTPEFAQDLNAYHSIDAEAELTSILSEYISMEIDL